MHQALVVLFARNSLQFKAPKHGNRRASDQHGLGVQLVQEVDTQLQNLALDIQLPGVQV